MDFLEQKLGISDGSQTIMELRLFRFLCLAAAVLTLFVVVPVDFLVHLSARVALMDLGFGVASLFIYRESCRGRHHIMALFSLYLVNLNLSWFATGGSQGCVTLYFFTLFVYLLIFFRGTLRWSLLTVALANAVGLIAAEPYFPQWIIPYGSTASRLTDLVTALTLSALTCSLMLWAVLASYDREQRRLTGLNADLQRTIAERIEAEQSLRQNRELLNAVIEGTSDAVYAKDTEGRYVLFNSGAARITGKSAAQALGKDDSFLFSCQEAEIIRERDREILSSGAIRRTEHELTNCAGERITVQATKGPLRDETGSVVGVFGISRDVTEHRRVEDEIRKLNAELDLRVTERSARLQAAIQEQESFCYSVSHDLRAPLRHINSFSAILEEDCGECLTPEARDYLERIRSSSRSMGKLIDDLLELSRIGRSELENSAVNLSELAGIISSGLQESEPERRGEFKIEAGLTARGDAILVQKMLENLLDNAWKYSRGRDLACIEVGRVERGGQEAFFVRDNGVGFDMAYQDKLFGAFQRLHGPEFAGTGIGLATVKRIIKRHEGWVRAEGVVNEGTTIFFTLKGGELGLVPRP